MKLTPDAQVVNAAADALFAAAIAYKAALATPGEDGQGFDAAGAALAAALSKSEEVRGAFESALDAAEIDLFDGMLDRVFQTTSSASAALDEAFAFVDASNRRMARLVR